MKFENRIFAKLQPWSSDAVVSSINAGIGDRILSHYLFQPSGWISPVKNTVWNSLYLYGGAGGNFRQFLSWNAEGYFKYRRMENDSYKLGIITDISQMGGFPQYKKVKPYKDSDGDGMPDEWEVANGLNPNDPSDANGDINGDGYTNIEKYINAIDTKKKVDWTNVKNNYDTLAEKGKLM